MSHYSIGTVHSHFEKELFEKAGIGIPHEDVETNDVCTFGFMVAEFLGAFRHASENYSDSPPRQAGGLLLLNSCLITG